jgi:hypothetical protein
MIYIFFALSNSIINKITKNFEEGFTFGGVRVVS